MSEHDVTPPGTGDQVEAVVKWFNLTKGYGFVAPADNSPDAFLHVSVLSRAGLQKIAEGTKLLVEIGNGMKGRQILRIVSVLGQVETQESPRESFTHDGPTEEMLGTVKWFKGEKGFGFISPDDKGKDVFVHKNVVVKIGLHDLQPGQRVKMRVHTAAKGREAVEIELAE